MTGKHCHWAVVGFLVAGAAWTSAYLYNPVFSRVWMSDADLMYLEQLFAELFQRGGSLSQWYLTPAPYFFPDMLGYFLLRPLVPNMFWAFYLFSLFQSLTVLALSMTLAYRLTGSRTAVLLTEASCLGGLALGLARIPPYTSVYTPTYHTGAFLVGLAVLWLTSKVMDSEDGNLPLLLYCGLLALGVASDLFLLVTFILPLCLSLSVYLWSGKPPYKRRIVQLISLAAMSSGIGILIAKLVAKSTAPPLLDVTLAAAMSHLTDLPSILLRILEVNLSVGLTFLVFYLILACRVGSRLASFKAPQGTPNFPLWELFTVLSASGLVLFLGLRGMLHFPEPDTTRYILTVVWLPISLVWLPLQERLNSDRLHRIGRLVVVLASITILWVARPTESQMRSDFTPAWVIDLDSHLQELEKGGRSLKRGVSTYWQAKVAGAHSDRGLCVAQYNADLNPYLWITTTRWYEPVYDFAIVNDSPEDKKFLEVLTDRCGPPEAVLDCGGKVRLVVFPPDALRLPLPDVGGYIWGVGGLTSGGRAVRHPRDQSITSPSEVVEPHIFVYGPYVQLEPGRYEALFRVKCNDGSGPGHILCEVTKGTQTLALEKLELAGWSGSKEREIALTFSVDEQPDGKLFEFRMWKEGAYSVTLRGFELHGP